MSYEVHRNGYLVSTDRSRLDLEAVHAFLSGASYWARGISREKLASAIEHSLPFGVYGDGKQVAFARVITDYETHAYLADVYVEEAYRGRGLSKLLMEAIIAHPRLQEIRRWLLGTDSAHGLYRKFGFAPLERPERWMERSDPEVYTRSRRREAHG